LPPRAQRKSFQNKVGEKSHKKRTKNKSTNRKEKEMGKKGSGADARNPRCGREGETVRKPKGRAAKSDRGLM